MKRANYSVLLLLFLANFNFVYAQDSIVNSNKYTAKNKGKFFILYGGNRGFYTDSDIKFTGDDHNFTIYNTPAKDKYTGVHLSYLDPRNFTLNQTNINIGYYISDHYNISFGQDHMKYVMTQNVPVRISGEYPNKGSYGEIIEGKPDEVMLTEDFLMFEHTNGLNYINFEIARVDDISHIFWLPNIDKFQVNVTEGLGAGILYPRTDATLLNEERYDEFHLAGFGLHGKVGVNFTIFKHFFLQAELKGGYINMPDIRTTPDSRDRASQYFWFAETVLSMGYIFRI